MIILKDILNEVKFRDMVKYEHIIDLPMFSIFVDKEVGKDVNLFKVHTKYITKIFNGARNEIHRLGFPSMHSNVVFKNLLGAYVGYAIRKTKSMEIDTRYFFGSDEKMVINTIVHEWAHLYMFNRSKDFKKAVMDYYTKIKNLSGKKLKMTDFPVELSVEDERKIIDMWGMAFRNFVFSILRNYNVSLYFFQKLGVTKDTLKLLPHGFTIWNQKLIKTLNTEYYGFEKRSGTLNVDTEVYAEKVNDGWIIGKNDARGNRTEAIFKDFNAVIEYLGEGALNVINKKLKKLYKEDYNENNIRRDMAEKLYDEVSKSLTEIVQKYKLSVSSVDDKKMRQWIMDAVLPNFFSIVEDVDKLKELIDTKNPYDMLWVNNPIKEQKKLSIINLIKALMQKTRKVQAKSAKILTGDEFSKAREALSKLANWVRGYGMSNSDEFWATAIEEFFKLPYSHRKEIIKLML
jgi:hypothetical protein